MDERDFELLADLAKTCNLTKSAQRLYTTQSALSKRIQKLEQELGTQLFLRTKKRLLLTPVLEGMIPHLNQINDSMEQIRHLAAAGDGVIAGTLKIGISSNYARYRLPSVLEEYMARYPKVEIRLNTHRSPVLYKSLQEHEISIAIIQGEYPWRDGDIVLSIDHMCLVVSEENRDVPLNRLPHIVRETDAGYFLDVSRWRNENNLLPTPSDLVVSDIPTVITLVERGIGWSVLPDICLDQFKGVIRPLRFKDGQMLTRKRHIFYRSDYFSLPQVRAFVDIVRQHEERRKSPVDSEG